MGRLSSTKDVGGADKMRDIEAKRCAEEAKEHGYSDKSGRAASSDTEDRIVWDEV